MNKQAIKPFDLWQETMAALAHEGVLLNTVGADGKPNTMTIGWMTAGIIWGKPIVTVLIRPSRYSFGRIEEVREFTVNVMPPRFAGAIQLCGSASGRDVDEQAVICYECRVVHTNDVIPANFAPDISASFYAKGDFHRIYFGELVAAYAAEDARELLSRPQY
ncbi:MAG: flavin reductase [Verrucomicrobia bacterium]|nr:flavin reductase [Verrucomicrobiota bacterium]